MNEAQKYTPTRRERFVWKWFPAKQCPLPDPGGVCGDCIHLDLTCVFSWPERIRILLTGAVAVRARITTEFPTGQTNAEAVSYPTVKETL